MSPRLCLILGIFCLLAAQTLSSFVLTPMRADMTPNRDVYSALKPGEFAGTLMLGGFRGLACDLLWSRAQSAKENGIFYESIALNNTISQIQPRFEQVWEFMAWDMAYNIAAEVEDDAGKWAWFIAGLEVNARGCARNPQSERLLRHLAWMFHHKGDDFRKRVEETSWSALINPVLAQVNAQIAPADRLVLLSGKPGASNFQLSERLYRASLLVGQVNDIFVPPYVRRMVCIAIERDGNRLRNAGRQIEALQRYVDSMRQWEQVLSWSHQPPSKRYDKQDMDISTEISEHNLGRLRRKAELMVLQLAADLGTGERAAQAVRESHWDELDKQLAQADAWKSAQVGKVTWQDEK